MVSHVITNIKFHEGFWMIKSDSQLVLDSIRRIVRVLRNFLKSTEKDFGLSTAQICILQKLLEAKRSLTMNELAEATLTHLGR